MNFYGNNLKQIRVKSKLSRKQVANLADISEHSLRAWEIETRIPKETDIRMLADFFKVSVTEISDLTDINIKKQYQSKENEFWDKFVSNDNSMINELADSINYFNEKFSQLPKCIEDASSKVYHILSSVDVPVYVKDSQGKFLTANNSFHKLIGSDFSELVHGLTETDISQIPFLKAKKNYLEDIELISKEISYKDKIGPYFLDEGNFLKATKKIVRDIDNNVTGLVATFVDITKLKQQQLSLDLFHSSLMQNQHYGIMFKEILPEGKANYLAFNKKAEEILDWKLEDLKQNHINPRIKTIHPDDCNRIISESDKAKLNKKLKPQLWKYRIIKKNKEIRWIRESMSFYQAGDRKFYFIHFSDITEEVKSKEMQDLTQEFFNIELQHGLWCYNENEHKFIFFNKSHEDNYGYTIKEQMEMNFYKDIVYPDDVDWLYRIRIGYANELKELRKLNKIINYEKIDIFRIIHGKTKEIRWIKESLKWVVKNNVLYSMCISEDITIEKAKEEEIKQLYSCFEDLSIGVAIYNPATDRYLYVNQKVCDIFERSKENYATLTYNEFKNKAQVFDPELESLFKPTKFPVNKDLKPLGIIANGIHKYIKIKRNWTIYNNQKCIIEYIEDVTEQIKHEQEITALRSLAELSPDGMFFYNFTDQKYIFINKALEDIQGYSINDFNYKEFQWKDVVYKDDVEMYFNEFNKARFKNGSFKIRLRVHHKNGNVIKIEETTKWLTLKNITYVLGIVRETQAGNSKILQPA